MDCVVFSRDQDSHFDEDDGQSDVAEKSNEHEEEVTFLYKLCDGASPKSYGINVARLAGMPTALIHVALTQSRIFEEQSKLNQMASGISRKITAIYERLVSILSVKNISMEELAFIAKELWRRYDVMKSSLQQ